MAATDSTPTADGGIEIETIDTIRDAIEAARAADSTQERETHIKDALGEAQQMRANTSHPYGADVQEQLVSALTQPEEEAPFFINRAENEIDRVEDSLEAEDSDVLSFVDEDGRDVEFRVDPNDDVQFRIEGTAIDGELLKRVQEKVGPLENFANVAEFIEDAVESHLYRSFDGDEGVPAPDPSEPPEWVSWIDEDHAVIEVEAPRALVEWIDLEAREEDVDGLEWIRNQLWTELTDDLCTEHGFSADVEVDVPEGYAKRLGLLHQLTEAQGRERDPEVLAENHGLVFEPTYTVEDEPLPLEEWGTTTNGED